MTQEEQNKQLLKAAQEGNAVEVNKLIEAGDNVNATKEDTTIEKDKAIAVSLNKAPEIPSIKINGRKTATRIKVVATIAKEICLEPL